MELNICEQETVKYLISQYTVTSVMAGLRKDTIYKDFYGTIVPRLNFDAEKAADALHESMVGVGCDKLAITKIIIDASNSQRQQVYFTYSIAERRRKSQWDN
ncbi:unnamed protein product [Enterobius vermicularis]|uniref:Phage protein n=1 Tax=Enterobius vermicularis TaxID=51028 RepID=A0A0N4VHN7_ENTVE|nr:unnamed protein product [Enterobius vermicularis]